MALELITGLGENTHSICSEVAHQLSIELGERVVWNHASTWEEMQARLHRGEVQMGWICGLLYTLLKREVDYLPLCAPLFDTQTQPIYFANLIVHQDSTIHDWEGLRGARWVINERSSYSGYHGVLSHLAQRGESLDFFSEVVASGTHAHSAQWVADGRADVASLDHSVYNYLLVHQPHLMQQVRVIQRLELHTAPPWIVHPDLPPATRQALRSVLLHMSPQYPTSGGVRQWVAIDDQRYAPLRQVYQYSSSLLTGDSE
ncbi:MAG: phosphate/phosphite/phosphonate ABC transporter substrate-binding protein [Phototrophicaceae bacterium]